MTEGIGKIQKILYLNINRQKFAFAMVLNSLSYIMRRVALIPLLNSLNSGYSFMNLLYMIVTFIFTFPIFSGRTFEKSISFVLPAISILMITHYTCDYSYDKIMNNVDEDSFFIDKSKASGWKKFFLDIFVIIARSEDQKSSTRSLFFMVVGLGFAFIVYCGFYTFTKLTIVFETSSDSFYEISHKKKIEKFQKGVTKAKMET